MWWRSRNEQFASVAERLLAEPLDGARVAIQLHGDDRHGISGRLRAAGAEVIEVPVYRWTLPEDTLPAQQLIEQVEQVGRTTRAGTGCGSCVSSIERFPTRDVVVAA